MSKGCNVSLKKLMYCWTMCCWIIAVWFANKPQHRIGSTVSFVMAGYFMFLLFCFCCFQQWPDKPECSRKTVQTQRQEEEWNQRTVCCWVNLGHINCGLTNQTYTYLCVLMYIKIFASLYLYHIPSIGLHFQRGRHF